MPKLSRYEADALAGAKMGARGHTPADPQPVFHARVDQSTLKGRVYVIDACNLIFQSRKLEETLENRGFAMARDMLTRMLARFADHEGLRQVAAVFDGSEKAAHHPRNHIEAAGRVLLHYACPRSDADKTIIDLVECAAQPGGITVVTGDNFITRNVLKAGSHHMSCREFLNKAASAARKATDPLLGEDPRKFNGGGMTDREMNEWLELMGFPIEPK